MAIYTDLSKDEINAKTEEFKARADEFERTSGPTAIAVFALINVGHYLDCAGGYIRHETIAAQVGWNEPPLSTEDDSEY